MPLHLCFDEADLLDYSEKYPKRYLDLDATATSAGVAARARGYLARSEFLDIAKWKSARPLKSYELNNDEQIREATRCALNASGDLERVIVLTALSGVRVRTATAILHMCHRDPCPLLDVWAMTAVGAPRDVTEKWDELDWLRAYPEYADFCRRLSLRTGHSLRLIDRALWSFGEASGSRRKRKKSPSD